MGVTLTLVREAGTTAVTRSRTRPCDGTRAGILSAWLTVSFSQAQPVQVQEQVPVCLDAGRLLRSGRTGAETTSELGSAGTADSSL
jgi:hypothetical protein